MPKGWLGIANQPDVLFLLVFVIDILFCMISVAWVGWSGAALCLIALPVGVMLYKNRDVLALPKLVRRRPSGWAQLLDRQVRSYRPAVDAERPQETDDQVTVIPDRVEPMSGWRCWQLMECETADGPLIKLTGVYRQEIWEPRQACEAYCLVNLGDHAVLRHLVDALGLPTHPVPDEECTCGLYSLATAHILDESSYSSVALLSSYPDSVPAVLGEVAIWGKTLVGEQGTRSQYAYPKRLIVPARTEIGGLDSDAIAEQLSELYGIPVEVATRGELTRWFARLALEAAGTEEGGT